MMKHPTILSLIFAINILLLGNSQAQTVLTIDNALEIAGKNSPDIIQLKLSLAGSQAALEAQRAALKSRFSLSLNPINYSKNRSFDDFEQEWYTNETFNSSGTFGVTQPITLTDGTISLRNTFGWRNSNSDRKDNIDNTYFSNNLYLQIDQPLFTYNRTKQTLKGLELDLENTQLRYAMALLNLELNVSRALYQVHSNQRRLSITKEELKNREKSYDIIKRKVDANLSAKGELYQAEIDLASSQASLLSQEVTVANAKDDLKMLLGMSLDDDIVVVADIAIDSVSIEMNKAVEYALENRMELRQQDITIQEAYMNLVRQKATNEFNGNLSLSLGLMGEDKNVDQVLNEPTRSPKIGVSFEVPLWDWGERDARIRQAQANIQSAEYSLEDEKKQIYLDIRKAYRNLQNLKFQVGIQEKNVKNAELTYEIDLEKYENGDLTSMDLNLSQNQLSQSKLSLSGAIIDYKMELLNLKILSLWDFKNNKSILETLPQNTDKNE